MTITAVALTGGPPAVLVTVTASAAITAIQLYRTANGATSLTRAQPGAGASTVSLGDFDLPWGAPVTYQAIYTAGGTQHTETASAITVPANGGWLIHPIFPTLSVPVTTGSCWVESVTADVRTANATSHQVIGSRFPVITTTGPRIASTLTLTLGANTAAVVAAVWNVVDDQTPLLIRFPDLPATGFDSGYYSVGDVTATRVGAATEQYRSFALPLTRVAPVAVAPRIGWDYPTLTSTYADYQHLTAAFASYPALTANQHN